MTLSRSVVTCITYTAAGSRGLVLVDDRQTVKRTSTVSKSALAITEEHNDLADAAIGQLGRLNSRAAARATLDDGSAHPADIWSAGTKDGWNGVGVAGGGGGVVFGLG